MSQTHLRLSDPTVKAIVHAAYPGFNGKDVRCTVSDTITFRGTNWDGGSKRDYVLVSLASMQAKPIPDQLSPWDSSEFHTKPCPIPEGFVFVVENHYSARVYIEIIGPASVVTPMLPAPIKLTPDEEMVLDATCCYKPSYNGISNYRFHECSRKGMTESEYNVAKASLIEKKFLNRAGAVTVEGRNARKTVTNKV